MQATETIEVLEVEPSALAFLVILLWLRACSTGVQLEE
jgi:hypothetical protein